jgi:putative nucleotidyltransferase with HDIG domain
MPFAPPTNLSDQDAWFASIRAAFAGSDPRRLAHIETVWRRGRQVAHFSDQPERFALACLLHDVGRALDPDDREQHALVGARYLRSLGLDESLVRLVAQHSGARHACAQRGCSAELEAYPLPEAETEPQLRAEHELLSYLDATTGPDGMVVSVAERGAELAVRYGCESRQVAGFALRQEEIRCGRAHFQTLGFFVQAERTEEKEASRRADAAELAAGEITAAKLNAQNAVFAGLARGARVDLRAAHRLI